MCETTFKGLLPMARSIAWQLYEIVNAGVPPALVLVLVKTNFVIACSINAPLMDPVAPELMRNCPDGADDDERTITSPVHCKLEFISKSLDTCRIPKPVRLAFSFRLLSVITSTTG